MLQQQKQRRKLQKQQQGRFCRLRTANAAAELASLKADVRRRSSSSGNTYRTSSKHEIYACAPRNAQNGGATKTIHSRNSHLRQKNACKAWCKVPQARYFRAKKYQSSSQPAPASRTPSFDVAGFLTQLRAAGCLNFLRHSKSQPARVGALQVAGSLMHGT